MPSGSRLGRYVVRRRIGAGGFATVWLCWDEQLDSAVAVKVLADNWAGDGHVRDRFLAEGRFLRRVDSPHVVPVYDAGELEDGRPFLVMAWADQGNLADRLELSSLSAGQALLVVQQVGAGLDALHRHGVLHRDVKPANVLFRSAEAGSTPSPVRAMLGDLGLGKAVEASSRLTLAGGTPSWAAPEQARGERCDARTDEYALAALAHLLVAGEPPFDHQSLVAAADPPPPRGLGPHVPTAVGDVLRRGMAVDPGQRFPDVDAFVAAFTAATGDAATADGGPGPWLMPDDQPTRPVARPAAASQPAVPAAPPTRGIGGGSGGPPSTGWRRPWVWPWAAALLALLAGAAGGWWWAVRAPGEVSVGDDSGSLRVQVPAAWAAARATGTWTPPGARSDFAALSVGTRRDWQEHPAASGVFVGLLPGTQLPADLPGHPECDNQQETVTDAAGSLGPTLTGVSTRCGGGTTVVERVVRVADNRLLWVQVRAADGPTATGVLEAVQVSGL